jgi:hypothetical protein
MRRIFAFCAAAGLGLTALAATSPAQAGFHLIRWQGTGFCQVWDEGVPTTPFPSDYTAMTRSHSLGTVIAIKERLLHKGTCTF